MTKATKMVTDIRGWDALDLDGRAFDEVRKQQFEAIKAINSDMRELFMDTELGQRVLGILIDWTVRLPTSSPEYTERMSCFREGQNEIVRNILAACNNSEDAG